MPEYIIPERPLEPQTGFTEQSGLGNMPTAPNVNIGVNIPQPSNDDPILTELARLSSGKSEQATYAPTFFDWEKSNADRYVQSGHYKTLGFDPNLGFQTIEGKPYESNELKYQEAQTWGDVIARGIGGAGSLAWNSFKGAAVSDGRMLNALFNIKNLYHYYTGEESFKEKFIGTPEELLKEDREQKAIMNKYAIYESPATEGVFNKEFLGSNLQQLGFTIGTGAYILGETLLTAGIANVVLPLTKAKLLTRVGKAIDASTDASKIQQLKTMAEAAKNGASKAQMVNDLRKLTDVAKNRTLMNRMWEGGKNFIPGYKAVEDAIMAKTAGATFKESLAASVPGLIRSYTMFNAAKAEASMEAAGTYGQMYVDLIDQFEKDNNRQPNEIELSKIEKAAYNASTDNFIVNTGILSIMNEIEFGNIMNKFSSTKRLFREAAEENGMKMFSVTGKLRAGEDAGKMATRIYETGKLGAMGKFGAIRTEFGLGTALWQAAKSWGRGAGKFEISEGVQELLQEASNNTFRDYYTNLYNANKDLDGNILKDITSADWKKGFASQMNMEGWKTFLMGATTGLFLSPLSAAAMYGREKGYAAINTEYKEQLVKQKELINENIQILNSFYTNSADTFFTHISNLKTQMHSTKQMKGTIPLNDKYTFFNVKDDALAKAASTAIKTGNINSFLDTIRSLGDGRMTDEEFSKAVGLPEGQTVSAREYTENVAKDIEQYHTNWQNLKDRFSDLVIPEMYSDPTDYAIAKLQKVSLDEAIELLATTDYNATKTIKRASELRSRMGNLKDIGSSVSASFDILGSKEQTEKELKSLREEEKLTSELPDPAMKIRNKALQNQIKVLENWQNNFDKYEKQFQLFKEGKLKELENELGIPEEAIKTMKDLKKSFNDYIISKNTETGIGPSVIDRRDLDEAFHGMSDYITLTNDHNHYVEALNVLTDPHNFRRAFEKIMDAINHAKGKSKDEAEEEIKTRAKSTIPSDEEEEETPDYTDVTGGEEVITPEPETVVPEPTSETTTQPPKNTQSPITKTTKESTIDEKLGATVGVNPVEPIQSMPASEYKPKFSKDVIFSTTGRHFIDKDDKNVNTQEGTHVAYATSEDLVISEKNPMFMMVVTKDNDPFGIWNPQFPNGVKMLLVDKSGNPIDKNGVIQDPKGDGKNKLVHWYLKDLQGKSVEQIAERFKKDYNTEGVSDEEILKEAKKYKTVLDAVLKNPKNAKVRVVTKRLGVPQTVALVDGKPQKLSLQNRLLSDKTNWTVMTHPNGMSIRLIVQPNGRTIMQRADGQTFRVYNRSLVDSEKETIINALKYLSKLPYDDKNEEVVKLKDILHGMIFYGKPEDINNPGANRIWIDGGKIWKSEGAYKDDKFITVNKGIPFTEESIETNKDRLLGGLYRNVNNMLLNEVNKPYIERTVSSDKAGEYSISDVKEWNNYQHSLLAEPEERTHMPEGERAPVIHTNVERYIPDQQETNPQVKQVELIWEFLGDLPKEAKPKTPAKTEKTTSLDVSAIEPKDLTFKETLDDDELESAYEQYSKNPQAFTEQLFKNGDKLVTLDLKTGLFEHYILPKNTDFFIMGGINRLSGKVQEVITKEQEIAPVEALVNPSNAEITNPIDTKSTNIDEAARKNAESLKGKKSTRKTNLDKGKEC